MALVKSLVVAAVAWLAGVATYFAALLLVYGEHPSWNGDTRAALFWSALAFGALYFALYVPTLHGLRRVLRGFTPAWPFPVTAAALGVVPTALIAFMNGGDVRSLASHEALLFYLMFAAIGVVAGIGFVIVHRSVAAP